MRRLIYCKTNQQLIIELCSSLHASFCYGACLACILPIFRLYMADSEVWPDISRLHMAVACGKSPKTHPEQVVSEDDVPYISEIYPDERGCGRFLGDDHAAVPWL